MSEAKQKWLARGKKEISHYIWWGQNLFSLTNSMNISSPVYDKTRHIQLIYNGPGRAHKYFTYKFRFLHIDHFAKNDTLFMNPSSHLHLSVNQQERSSSQRGARLRLSLKNVQWPSLPFPSFPESAEHQACWTKNSYYLETMIWEQEAGTSASRSHETGSWR